MKIKIIQGKKEYTTTLNNQDTAYNAILSIGATISAPCGGKCTCGKCRVQMIPAPSPTEGELKFLSPDEVADGIRLACVAVPAEDCTILLPEVSGAVISTESIARSFALNPVCGGEYGAAIDIGTTTVAAYLVCLQTGETVDILSSLNPQKSYGADVISRIQYVLEHEDGGHRLKQVITDHVSSMVNTLLTRNGISTHQLGGLMIVGNTTMLHLLCGFDVSGIAVAPFTPANTAPIQTTAGELGLNLASEALVFIPPCVSGYVGADTLSAMIAADVNEESNSLLADIGTNGEIVLAYGGNLYAAATAAGPAFEGANISCGMAGIDGAVDKVFLESGKPQYTTIGNTVSQGICGSGLLDLAAVLIETGVVDETGRLLDIDEIEDPVMAPYVQEDQDGQNCFYLTETVFLTAKDIRQLQLAKSAIAAGIIVLAKEGQAPLSELDALYLAGGFGSYLRKESALAIGLLPREMKDKIVPAGNAAGGGAVLMLLDKSLYEKAQELVEKICYIELSNSKEFMDEFVMNMGF